MKLGGVPERIEVWPESEAEKAQFQRVVDGDVLIFWGDADRPDEAREVSGSGTVLVLNSTEPVVTATGEESPAQS